MPAGSAAVAASMYLRTLSVENCGAIGMPIARVTPAAASSASASLMNGAQLRIPTATGIPGPGPRAHRAPRPWGDVGERRAAADGAVVRAHLVHELLRRRPPAAHQRQILRHLVQRGRSTVGHQQHPGAESGFCVHGARFRVRSTFMAPGSAYQNSEPRTLNAEPRTR